MRLKSLLDKFFYYTKYFYKAEKSFRWPRKSEVLIFDATNSSVLMDYLFPWNPEILHVRGEKIFIPVFIQSLMRKGNKTEAYKDCFIEKVDPKLIVTFIDNNFTFYTLSERHLKVKTLFIQNGLRGLYGQVFDHLKKASEEERAHWKVDYMLTLGTVPAAVYSTYLKGNNFSIGSLKNNQAPVIHQSQKDLLVFISQWGTGSVQLANFDVSEENFFRKPDQLVFKILTKFACKHKKTIKILPRTSADSLLRVAEKNYFDELLGQETFFLEGEKPYSSYNALDLAQLIVSIDSTLGYEAVARGKKTALLPIRSALTGVDDRTFGWPAKFPATGPYWTNSADPEIMEGILEYLITVSDSQWKNDVELSHFSSIMNYDPGNSIFKSILAGELSSSQS